MKLKKFDELNENTENIKDLINDLNKDQKINNYVLL